MLVFLLRFLGGPRAAMFQPSGCYSSCLLPAEDAEEEEPGSLREFAGENGVKCGVPGRMHCRGLNGCQYSGPKLPNVAIAP